MTAQQLADRSKCLCSASGSPDGFFRGSNWWVDALHLTPNGKYFVAEFGGCNRRCSRRPHWMSRAEAVEFAATRATCAYTGYGYTREQAEMIVDGKDPGRGERQADANEME